MIPSYNCVTVRQDDTLKTTLEKMEFHQIDGLPVLKGEEYVGIVTRFNIYKGFFGANKSKEEYLQTTLAGDRMSFQEKFLTGNEIFEATLFELKDFPLLAVVDDKRKFKGVVTRQTYLNNSKVLLVFIVRVRIAFTTAENRR